MESTFTSDILRLIGVVILVFANGFFVAAEFSLVSVRKTRIEELLRQGKPGAASVKRALEYSNAVVNLVGVMPERGPQTFQGTQALGAPNLTDSIWLWGGSVKAVTETVTGGRGSPGANPTRMPSHKDLLDPARIKLVGAYVWSLSNPQK